MVSRCTDQPERGDGRQTDTAAFFGHHGKSHARAFHHLPQISWEFRSLGAQNCLAVHILLQQFSKLVVDDAANIVIHGKAFRFASTQTKPAGDHAFKDFAGAAAQSKGRRAQDRVSHGLSKIVLRLSGWLHRDYAARDFGH